MASATEIRDLGTRNLYRWGLGVGLGALLVFASVLLATPENAWLVALFGVLVVSLLGSAAIDVALGDRLGAAGSVIGAGGFFIWAVGASASFPDWAFQGGLALLFLSGAPLVYRHGRPILSNAIARVRGG